MIDKRFIEFATQNTDNGEINNGFQDIKTGEWYYTKDSENAEKICGLLNELYEENRQLLCTIVEILDFIEDKREVSIEEMRRWWKEKEKELSGNDCINR